MTDDTSTDKAIGELPAATVADADLGTTLTLRETAARLGRSVKTVRRMVANGAFPEARQVPMPGGKGQQWVVPYSDLLAWERDQAARAELAGATVAPVVRQLTDLGHPVHEALQRVNEANAALAEALRERDEARHSAELFAVMAEERAATIGQLSAALDALRLALPPAPAPVERRRWWHRGK